LHRSPAAFWANRAAILAALTEPWSNCQTESQITKLKRLRRQMYGRGNIDLLRQPARRARKVGQSPMLVTDFAERKNALARLCRGAR
jgi:hypothetical protein